MLRKTLQNHQQGARGKVKILTGGGAGRMCIRRGRRGSSTHLWVPGGPAALAAKLLKAREMCSSANADGDRQRTG